MKKRKKLKIFLLSVLVIVLAAGGYLLYEFKFKEYDTADEEVSEIIEEAYEVELPDGTIITMDKDGNIIEDTSKAGGDKTGSGTVATTGSITGAEGSESEGDSTESNTASGSTNANGSTNSNGTAGSNGSSGSTSPSTNTGSTTKPSTTPEAEVTVASIKAKYTPVFQGLEGQADAKINALIGRAKSEYQAKKANGESVNFGYFYNKYMDAASGLEANTDSIFNGVLSVVEKELQANGFDKSYAQSFKTEYEATKEARRSNIINKALGR